MWKQCKKKVFKNIPEGKRSVGRPKKSWLDGVENHLKEMDVRGWRKVARDRDAWKLILKEAMVPHGERRQVCIIILAESMAI